MIAFIIILVIALILGLFFAAMEDSEARMSTEEFLGFWAVTTVASAVIMGLCFWAVNSCLDSGSSEVANKPAEQVQVAPEPTKGEGRFGDAATGEVTEAAPETPIVPTPEFEFGNTGAFGTSKFGGER